jgi:hypothetical protein
MSTGRLHPESAESWLKTAVVQVDLSKVQPVLKNFIKAVAILAFGLLLQFLVDFSQNPAGIADKKVMVTATIIKPVVGDSQNADIEVIQAAEIK